MLFQPIYRPCRTRQQVAQARMRVAERKVMRKRKARFAAPAGKPQPSAARIQFRDGQVCRWNPATGFELDGRPLPVTGVNYVARHVCTNFWEEWRPAEIFTDLDRIAAAGLEAVRVPIHWEYAEPRPGVFNPVLLERLDAFLAAARARGLFVLPWFLVGVATRNYDVAWRKGRSFFGDFMTRRACVHLRFMVRRLRAWPNILAWDLCDEPEWYSTLPRADAIPYDTEAFHRWLEALCRAVKSEDPGRAVTLGFGNIADGNYGFDLRRAARALDGMSVTAYPRYRYEDVIHAFRNTHFLGWSLRFNDCAGKGVFAGESPGWTDVESSESAIAASYRVSLYSAYLSGSRANLPWAWNDFDSALWNEPPIDRSPSEARFGICRAGGALKPAGRELADFAAFCRRYPPHRWTSRCPVAGVIVPVESPPAAWREFERLFHHYILLRQCGVRVRYVWPEDLPAFDGAVLFLPDSESRPLANRHWAWLRSWVAKGGALISSSRHAGTNFNELFGVELEGRVRQPTPFAFHAAGKARGSAIFVPPGGYHSPVALRSARALYRTADGEPAVTLNRFGAGRAAFVSYPPESVLASLSGEALAGHAAFSICRRLLDEAGCDVPFLAGDPRLEMDVLADAAGRRLLVAVNHSRRAVRGKIRLRAGGVLVRDLPACGVFIRLLY